LILGRAHFINRLKKHPLIRTLRVDKSTLAALQATLLAYLENRATVEIPVWRMIAADINDIARRARKWRSLLLQRLPQLSPQAILVVNSSSTVGGGSLPGQTLPTKALAISMDSVDVLAAKLRQTTYSPPVVARIESNQLLMDPRTVLPEQDKALLSALECALTDLRPKE
jgi:L-seryl-tRNA(Ser) seleniumtransferase